jgi:hypothetical protein
MTDSLQRLQEWYRAQCDGDWEHQFGVKVLTLDNPGWRLHVDLSRTPLEDKPMIAIDITRHADDWLDCRVEDAIFKACGGPSNLTELVECFLTWAAE